ncbi:hypothetical protein GWI33_003077 [Rhynchophorus ferrugineus]|uniref:Uncharacterized protein n=1 Tax=Rhynchophorus ferrugineus TaxID=354439 RepID=A0A834MG08_RHYFE|nr:hypothetical protein GWI33_003077 [Rhynchophorus ferrugineus]
MQEIGGSGGGSFEFGSNKATLRWGNVASPGSFYPGNFCFATTAPAQARVKGWGKTDRTAQHRPWRGKGGGNRKFVWEQVRTTRFPGGRKVFLGVAIVSFKEEIKLNRNRPIEKLPPIELTVRNGTARGLRAPGPTPRKTCSSGKQPGRQRTERGPRQSIRNGNNETPSPRAGRR